MKNYIKPSLILVVLIVLGTFVFVGAQQNQNNFSQGTGSGSGTVSANNGVVNAIATYAAAGGSTTVAPAANTACIPGATSGSVCLTAPAVAGTATNALTLSNVLAVPSGAAATAALQIGAANTGLFSAGAGAVELASQGSTVWSWGGTTSTRMASGVALGWSSTGSSDNSADTGLSRTAAAVVALGNGTASDTTARVKAAGYMSGGTTFTSNAGCTESALTGGATAGKFTVGTGTACTIVITMGNTATAPNGWTCTAYDNTSVPTVAIRQTAQTATSCSLLMTVTASDVIVFSAIGW